MSSVTGRTPVYVVDHRDLQFSQRGGPPGNAGIVRALPDQISPNLGVGFGKWEGAEVSWTVLYDEVIFVFEGLLKLKANGECYEVGPGQMLWIPEATVLEYSGHATFGYVVYPGDWKKRLPV
ncbi:ethanolamine utilization protein EutQ [Pseudomonas sp. KCA11]|nr:ethanolamine utilization protein EutQ [Pseudomonas sp. KCA11]MCE5993858.1 ethanolamine utilization protein EutQ [Pseudomonas sp. KCA11]